MKKFYVLVFIFNLLTFNVFAGSLTVSVDKNEASIYDQFYLKIKVSGSFDDKVKIPDISGVSIQEAGVSRSVNIINGATSKSVEYSYILRMDKEGSYTIPEISLKIDGKVEKSEKIELKVTSEVADEEEDEGSTDKDSSKKNKDVFLERKIEPESVYIGETILARSLFYYRTAVNDLTVLSKGYPDSLQTVVTKKNKNYSLVKNGIEYNVLESSDILLPTKVGDVEIPAFVVKAQIPDKKNRSSGFDPGFGSGFFDDFFSRTSYISKIFTSKGKTIKVKPLPKPVPTKFSGLVGSFKMSSSLSKQELNVGDTTTLTVSIEGEGYLEGLDEKSLRLDLDKSLKVYADKPSFTRNDGKILKETKVFKFALVPTKKGDIEAKDITLNVFVPKLGTYVDLSASIPKIQVTGDGVLAENEGSLDNGSGIDNGNVNTNKNDVKYINQDIKDIKRKGFSGSDSVGKEVYRNCFYILVVPTGLIILKIILIFVGIISNRENRKRSRAYKKFISKLSSLNKKKDGFNLDEIKDVFFDYMEQRFGSGIKSKTIEELVVLFKQYGIDDNEFISILRMFDSLVYGGISKSSIDRNKIIDVLKKQVDKINSIRL